MGSVPRGAAFDDALVKNITGGDAIQIRGLYQAAWAFTPTFKLFFTTNHRPKVRGDEDALWRRIAELPFNAQVEVEEMDVRLPEKLATAEIRSAILAWAVKGCQQWKELSRLEKPKIVQESVQAYREEMASVVERFVKERTRPHNEPGRRLTNPALLEAATAFADETGEEHPTTRSLSAALRKAGMKPWRVGEARGWCVMLYNPDSESQEPDGWNEETGGTIIILDEKLDGEDTASGNGKAFTIDLNAKLGGEDG